MFLIRRFSEMTPGGIAGFAAVLALAGMGAFVAGARWVNTSPSQCASCHPELTAMWERSQGHPADRVLCHECHTQHVELPESPNALAYVRDTLIPERYLSADERIEPLCEGCHAGIRGAETEQRKIIKLNHKVHLAPPSDGQPALGCLDCHRNIAHDKALLETNRPTMAGCFAGECHRKDRNKDNCRRCHYQHLAEPSPKVL